MLSTENMPPSANSQHLVIGGGSMKFNMQSTGVPEWQF